MSQEAKGRKAPGPEDKKETIHIPLVPIPSDEQELEDEMREMFQEDQVRHKHGSTEPERD